MKLLIVTSQKESKEDVVQILEQAEILEFDITESIGFKGDKNTNLLDGWFSIGKEHFDSLYFISFTEEKKEEKAIALIKNYNGQKEDQEQIKAFVIPIERSVY